MRNLNGDPAGVDSPGLAGKYALFLRGGTASGVGQDQMVQQHSHGIDPWWQANYPGGPGWDGNPDESAFQWDESYATQPYGGPETRPRNMSVVWIMRVR